MTRVRELSQRVGGVEYAVDRLIERLEILSEKSDERFAAFEKRMDERSVESARKMDEFRQRMDESDQKRDEENKQHRREQGKLSQKMGTLVEDLVAPSIPRILQEVMRIDDHIQFFGVRVQKGVEGGRSKEYDAVVVSGEYMLINETKGRLQLEDTIEFQQTLFEARDFFPEYADKRIVGAMASLYVDPSLVVKGEREGLIMLGAADGIMELLNKDYFKPRLY